MPTCSYCKRNYKIPKGLTLVLPNGDLVYYCSSKCRKNSALGRKSDKVRWIKKKNKKEQ
ncbi:MAG: 50S ribosomal protein L24e [Candidatus Pacearchaeota archaeon]